jgi:4-hydroxy-3-polyprenylbenzoate decarboxylase
MRKIVVGISGASGSVYGFRLVQALAAASGVETHLVISAGAKRTMEVESNLDSAEVEKLADFVHDERDLAAPIASGSFGAHAMVVLPCSIKTLSAIANCYADNLLTRAADVMLKERRTLILGVRETPLHRGHLKLMLEATENGAVIVPPMVALYNHPKSVEEVIDHGVGRVLDLLEVEHDLYRRWTGPGGSAEVSS